MRFVALKSEAQLDVQTLHRVRDQLVGERTALTNQIRSILLERGYVVAQGRGKLAACLAELLDAEPGASLTPRMRTLVAEVRERWQDLDRRIAARYAPRRSDDGDLRSRLREIAAERRRFGYRRLGIMLACEGLVMNHKKLLRLYREENLRVRRRRGRKRAMGTRAPMALPQGPNQRWSLDFVSDRLISGRRIRILAVVDTSLWSR